MSVKIRMARHGTKKKPFYRIVVADSEAPRNGAFLEIVGTFDPRAKTNQVVLKTDRILHWIGKGAQPSQTVGQLIKKNKVA
ncbi:30S ribosomal protein S16 [Deltaproteobacteria bacterium PRO3]|nr:30S ribosomal protein S16 [Deltaproteobacteria bacterium]MDL1871681.1 30S ribosomal protein S16 [Deltaproteobacteria bacterium PRO3]